MVYSITPNVNLAKPFFGLAKLCLAEYDIYMSATPEQTIAAAGFPVYLHGLSAIDSYLGRNGAASVQILCGADLADLARLFEGLRYPGAAFADAAVDSGGKTWYFRCEDALSKDDMQDPYRFLWKISGHSLNFLEFYQDCTSRRFYDPHDIYPLLRSIRDNVNYDETDASQWWKSANVNADSCHALFDAAVVLARYFSPSSPEDEFSLEGASSIEDKSSIKGASGSRDINAIAAQFGGLHKATPPVIEEQRLLLINLLEAANPAPGFELLKKCGFIAAYWPELAILDDVDHSKEFHPEGNAWKHTLETFRYRKPGANGVFDLCLSLGLLLHDMGKPIAASFGSHRFDGHAELGARAAARFLERLEFNPSLVQGVYFLVKNHMLPAALKRLPVARTGEIMASPLFPLLMELYRCDESSSFKGLDGYYENSAAYQSYLRNVKNPYRSADGKKTNRNAILLGKK